LRSARPLACHRQQSKIQLRRMRQYVGVRWLRAPPAEVRVTEYSREVLQGLGRGISSAPSGVSGHKAWNVLITSVHPDRDDRPELPSGSVKDTTNLELDAIGGEVRRHGAAHDTRIVQCESFECPPLCRVTAETKDNTKKAATSSRPFCGALNCLRVRRHDAHRANPTRRRREHRVRYDPRFLRRGEQRRNREAKRFETRSQAGEDWLGEIQDGHNVCR